MTTLYEYYESEYDSELTIYDPVYGAQDFTVGAIAHSVTSVKIYAWNYGSPKPTTTVTAEIRTTDVNGKPTSTILATQTVDGSGWSTTEAWHTITFDTPAKLSANTKYALVMRAATNHAFLWCAVGYGAESGFFSSDYGSTWDDAYKYFWFEIWGNPAPTTTTQAVSSIAKTTSTGNGNITVTFENCTKRGVCWNTTGTPTVADSKTEETGSFGVGAFIEAMASLTPGTLYYVRAYAYNSGGYGYGNQVTFTTKVKGESISASLQLILI